MNEMRDSQLSTDIFPHPATPSGRPFDKDYELPSKYQLPPAADCSMQGELYRQTTKGLIKSWTREVVMVQQNLLLACSNRNPCLVRVCVPLRNVATIEKNASPKEPTVFEIAYVEAGSSVKGQPAVMRLKADTPGEMEQWVRKLTTFRKIAVAKGREGGAFVTLSDAQNAMKELHNSVRNSALYSLCITSSNSMLTKQTLSMEWAWRKLQNEIRDKAVIAKEAELGQKELEAQEELGKQEARNEKTRAEGSVKTGLNILVRAIELNMRRTLQTFSSNVERRSQVLHRQVSGQLLSELVKESEIGAARRVIDWRKRHLKSGLERAFSRVLRSSFTTLKLHDSFEKRRREQIATTVGVALVHRRQRDVNAMQATLHQWHSTAARMGRQQEAVAQIYSFRRRGALSGAIHAWLTETLVLQHRQVEGLNSIARIVENGKKLDLGSVSRSVGQSILCGRRLVRQTYRQTDRQTDTHTYRQTDRQTDTHTYRQTDRQADSPPFSLPACMPVRRQTAWPA
eukprot:GHVU01019330.1.p1 GENE.GHVU01019330.1~~GHVU01019330.1.p1  ORF type:complete len:513 (+),score=93.37 GHVU01019330.1:798-2336(+)